MKTEVLERSYAGNEPDSGVRVIYTNRDILPDNEFHILQTRAANDPMLLYWDVVSHLLYYFLNYGTTCISGQLETLQAAEETVLSSALGTVSVVSLAPGGGKSTLLRAVMTVLAQTFADMTNPIAQRLGGAILVVEKSAEAHEYEKLCNTAAGRTTAIVVESANDYVLRQGGCMNGTATCYSECAHRSCPDYDIFPAVQTVRRTQETPILILLHARYQAYMEDMASFLDWYDEAQQHYRRTLLLVDELPPIIEPNSIDLPTVNSAESELDKRRPSYDPVAQRDKQELLWLWDKYVRHPFKRLSRSSSSHHNKYYLVSPEEMQTAVFSSPDLESLQQKLILYAADTKAEQLVSALLSNDHAYFSVGQTLSLTLPRLKKLHGLTQPATIIFSGTASLSPEIMLNPNVTVLPDLMDESYQRLTIMVQRGDDFNISRTAMRRAGNLRAMVAWLESLLTELVQRHNKVLLVTYQLYAEILWEALDQFHDHLIPYMDPNGTPTEKLPYFGGVQGSNAYLSATAVVCAGLNRFDAQDYLSRALAVDFQQEIPQEFRQIVGSGKRVRLDQIPSVMDAQDITLARDIVQLVFRSALRRHGGKESIELWIAQPPNGVLRYLKDYFGDCQIKEISELPDACLLATLQGETYNGSQRHWAKLLEWLLQWDGSKITPEQIRQDIGLSQAQFKEAKKHPRVRKFFADRVLTIGSGKNTSYMLRTDAYSVA